jgi:NADH-quinone oxidoreductase subunit C
VIRLSSTEADATPEDAPEVEPDELREGLVGRLGELLGDDLLDSHIVPGVDLTVRVSNAAWAKAGEEIRYVLGARYFCFLSAIDWMPSPFGRYLDAEVDTALARAAGEVESKEPEPITTGVCGGDTRLQVFARVTNVRAHWGITVKADVASDDDPSIETWTKIYAGADWHERETWEMFGITFVGHPNLRHIYLPGDFEGHPLRKDFPLLARVVKPWPGIVDVEPMPAVDEPEGQTPAEASGDAEGGTGGEEASS